MAVVPINVKWHFIELYQCIDNPVNTFTLSFVQFKETCDFPSGRSENKI